MLDPSSPHEANLVSSTIHGFPEEDEDEDVEVRKTVSPKLVQQRLSDEKDEHEKKEDNTTTILANVITPTFDFVPPQPQQQVVQVVGPPSDIYTLTLTDGSIVQLKVQNNSHSIQQDYNKQQQQPSFLTTAVEEVNDNNEDDHDKEGQRKKSALSADEQATNLLECWHQLCHQSDRLVSDESLLTSKSLCEEIRATSATPPSVAEEIILPFNHPTSGPLSPPVPTTDDSLSPSLSTDAAVTLPNDLEMPTGLFSSSRRSSDSFSESSSEMSSDESAILSSMFSSMDTVTIESLKQRLTALPEGQQTDLGALLVAAKIDLTVEDIVGPPLAQVKRLMEQKNLLDWQTQLCIKIRRRKKNTVSLSIK